MFVHFEATRRHIFKFGKMHSFVARIAVDVVLIPPNEVIELATGLNNSFPASEAYDFVLNERTCIPHITLSMGIIAEEQLPEVNRRLGLLAQRYSALDLTIGEVSLSKRPDGRVMSGLEIMKTKALEELHLAVLAALSDLFTYDDVQTSLFFSPPPLNRVPTYWVAGFAKTSVRENYKPHITLGVGEPTQPVPALQFRASTLALCHLGNYCTARKILFSSTLQ